MNSAGNMGIGGLDDVEGVKPVGAARLPPRIKSSHPKAITTPKLNNYLTGDFNIEDSSIFGEDNR